jgi:GT2 family glycosyltransferase
MLPALTLSVVIPATNRPDTLDRCLAAIASAADAPEQVIVVEQAELTSPAAARNAGAAGATGDILVFIDADVEVHPDVFTRIRRTFAERKELSALFGSYDDAPSERDAVSGFRNLLHHHVHQASAGRAVTFWAGLGAVRRDVFKGAGGFVDHPVEDIELGMRLARDGAAIELDPAIQGKHLKAWTLRSIVYTDLLVRGIPWVKLLLQHRSTSQTLNLGWRHRASAVSTLLLVAGGVFESILLAGVAVAALLAMNASFYALLVRRRGIRQAAVGFLLHMLHYLIATVALAVGTASYAAQRQRREAAPEAPASLAAPPA